MNREVSLKTLVALIVIAGLILGFIIYRVAKNFSDDMNQYYAPIQQEKTYLNNV